LPEAAGDVDLSKFFVAAFKTIAMAKVSSSARHALSIGFLNTCDRIVMNRDQIIGEAKKEALSMALSGYHPPQKKPVKVFGDAGKGMVSSELDNLFHAGKVSQYDRFLANRIAHVISGGDVRTGSEIDETVILKLERQAFVDFWREENTRKRVEHMLKTGKPLRN
jgi:3-hydroxyacyl-CoA dehydrogenase